MFPSRDYQRRFDDFLAIRRKLTRLDLLADYNGNTANISEDQVRNRLQNSNEINPFAGASLAKAYHQMDVDFGGVWGSSACSSNKRQPTTLKSIFQYNDVY